MAEPVISVKNVSKDFIRYKNNHQRMLGEILGRDTGFRRTVLRDISFDIEKGEKVAIIGKLGSGRTTLLRIIAGIIHPDSGNVSVNGDLSTIFSHRLTFDAALTGRDNMKMRASLMGWSREFLHEHEAGIIEFADLADVIDQPVSTYPFGSANRLGFTLETEIKPQILLYDEGFTVGMNYQLSCYNRFEKLVEGDDTTMIISLGNLEVCRKLCTRALVLHNSELVYDGAFVDALKYYRANCKYDNSNNDEDIDGSNGIIYTDDAIDSDDNAFGDF